MSKKTIDFYYSDVANEVEFGSEEDQKAFDTELTKLISDPASKGRFLEWKNRHKALNEIVRQNGEFNENCLGDFPFEDLLDLAAEANGFIGFYGLDDDMDRWVVWFCFRRFG